MRASHQRPEIDTSAKRLLRLQAQVHLALPLVVLALVLIVGIDFLLDPGPLLARAIVLLGYLVVAYFVLELTIEYRLYRDKRAFFRDRYVDILLTVPAALLLPFVAGAGGLVLSIRALQVLEATALVRYELLVVDEFVIAGSKLQKVGKLIRSTRVVLTEKLSN